MTTKKRLTLALLLVGATMLLLVASPLAAQDVQSVPSKAPENHVIARVAIVDVADLEWLSAEYDVWSHHLENGYVSVYLDRAEVDVIRAQGLSAEIDLEQTEAIHQPRLVDANQLAGIPGFACYRTVEETHTDMQSLATAHPTLVTIVDMGDSWDKINTTAPEKPGYDMLGMIVSNTASGAPTPKPRFYLIGAIHAREYTTAETTLRFAEHLVNNYGTDPDITWLLDHYELHVLPQANPDGRKIAETGTSHRKNTNENACGGTSSYGVDLNRNSSFKWGLPGSSGSQCNSTYRGPSPASEPEVQAIQNYGLSIFPDQRGPGDNDAAPDDATGIFITMHSYGNLVLPTWAYSGNPTPNHDDIYTLGRKMGFYNQYEVCGTTGGTVDGCLSAASGTTDDFVYGELGVASYTFEMGSTFFESCTPYENTIYPNNLDALLYTFKAARRPYQTPAGPEVINISATTSLVASSVTIDATADDTRYDSGGHGTEATQNIAGARYSVDNPSWVTTTTAMSAADGSFNTKSEGVTATIDTSAWSNGQHIVYVEGQDVDGNWGVPTAVFVTVSNPPSAVTMNNGASQVTSTPLMAVLTALAGVAVCTLLLVTRRRYLAK